MYDVTSAGYQHLPDELCVASESDVEDVVRRAAAYLGWQSVTVERVASVLGGSCIASVDVVAKAGGTAVVVARERPY